MFLVAYSVLLFSVVGWKWCTNKPSEPAKSAKNKLFTGFLQDLLLKIITAMAKDDHHRHFLCIHSHPCLPRCFCCFSCFSSFSPPSLPRDGDRVRAPRGLLELLKAKEARRWVWLKREKQMIWRLMSVLVCSLDGQQGVKGYLSRWHAGGSGGHRYGIHERCHRVLALGAEQRVRMLKDSRDGLIQHTVQKVRSVFGSFQKWNWWERK